MAIIDIRPGTADDAPQVAEIWYRGWQDGHLGNVPEALVAIRTEESFRERAGQRVADTIVVTVDGAVAGFVMVAGDELEQVFVSAGHRGTGVAAAVLAAAEQRVARAGHSRAWLAVVPGNTRARRFYGRNGWTDEGPFDLHTNGVVVPAHRYVKLVQGR